MAIHQSGETSRLTGGRARLLAVLVAAGPLGLAAERIADEIWGDVQPNPWRPALRMAVTRVRKALPEGWDVVSESGGYRIEILEPGWIDAWRLDELASASGPVDESDLEWMLRGAPFAESDMVGLVGSYTEHLRLLQIAAAERYCEQRPTSATTATCSALTQLLREHPYNERMALKIARALSDASRHAEARAGLAAFADVYVQEFDELGAEIESFLAQRESDKGPLEVEPAALSEIEPVLPKELWHLGGAPFCGRQEALQVLVESSRVLVTGTSGAGKSRLVAELIMHDRVTETTYVLGDDRLELFLGPFAVAIPELRSQLFDDVQTEVEADFRRAAVTRAWQHVLGYFEGRARTRPQRLVVDDAHLLDAASLDLLRLLVRSNTDASFSVVIASQYDHEEATIPIFDDPQRAGLDVIELGGFDLGEVETLVYHYFPDATHQARRGLATEVLALSSGLPAVAGALVPIADPNTLALPEHLREASIPMRVTAGLADSTIEVASAAALFGMEFSVGAVVQLADLAEAAALNALDELWSAGLVLETDDADRLRFRNLFIQRAFLETVPSFRRTHLHLRAAGLTASVHEQAFHLAEAGSLAEPGRACHALIESARALADNRRWRRAASQLRRSDELSNELLDAQDLALWATALDRSGADGSEPRRRAYQGAVDAGRWDLALAAAVAGLPEAERADGDVERIRMLEGIPIEQLEGPQRFELVNQLARQHSLAGNAEAAARYVDQAIDHAVLPDEIGLSHVMRWTATRHVQPGPPAPFDDDVLQAGSLSVRARLSQMSAIGMIERGSYDDGRREADRFSKLAAELGDPLRIWQAMVLQSMFVMNAGQHTDALTLIRDAKDYAELHSLIQGPATWAGQIAYLHHVQGRLAELWTLLEPYRVNMRQSSYGQSMLMLAQTSAGENEPDPAPIIRSLAVDALERPRSPSLVVLAFISSLANEYAADQVPALRSFLDQCGTNPIVAGFGLGDLGPAVRYVANLSSDPIERAALINDSITAADAHGTVLWKVLTRVDLALLGNDDHLWDEAAQLATGTDLEGVVAARFAAHEADGPSR